VHVTPGAARREHGTHRDEDHRCGNRRSSPPVETMWDKIVPAW
jgi:hypothetical protein